MPTRLDEIAELLLKALASPDPDAAAVSSKKRLNHAPDARIASPQRTRAPATKAKEAREASGRLTELGIASPLLTREEAAAYLRIGVRTLSRLKIAPLKVGGRVFYTQEILDAWLESKTPRAAAARRSVDRSSPASAPKGDPERSKPAPSTTLTDADMKNIALLSRPRTTEGAASGPRGRPALSARVLKNAELLSRPRQGKRADADSYRTTPTTDEAAADETKAAKTPKRK